MAESRGRAASGRNASGREVVSRRVARRAIAFGFAVAAYGSRRASAPFIAHRARTGRSAISLQVIAHRGASADAPENTLPAFERAIEQGAKAVELDVQLSRDGELIVYHDARLKAKTGAEGRICNHEAETLRALEVGSWFDATHPGCSERFAGTPLVALDEVFESFGDRLIFHVEIKSREPSLPERVLAAIDRHGIRSRVTITSFRSEALLQIRARAPEVRVCRLIRSATRLRARAMDRSLLRGLRARTLACREIERAAMHGFDEVALPARDLDRRIVTFARNRALGIRAWKVRNEDELDRVIVAGADGVTVDSPARAFAHLAARRPG